MPDLGEVGGDVVIGAIVTGIFVGVLHIVGEGISEEAFKKARRRCPCKKRHKRKR